MLKRVEIQNFALIETAIFEPGQHLTVISGETGAGKSLLIDALGSLTGKMAKREVVRSGADFARVEAVFEDASGSFANRGLAQYFEDDQLILSREIRAGGGSQARLNGRLISIGLLKEISSQLIGLHAQNEQLTIFDEHEQRALLDRYAGEKMENLLREWQVALKVRRKLAEKIQKYGLSPTQRSEQVNLLTYQIEEISLADLKIDEDAVLLERSKILGSLQRMREELGEAGEILAADSEYSVSALLARAVSLLEFSSQKSQTAKNLQIELKEIAYNLSQLHVNLKDLLDELKTGPGELEAVNERLDLIGKLKLKYGDRIEDILDFQAESVEKLKALAQNEDLFNECRKKLVQNTEQLQEIADKMHRIRQEAGLKLSHEIELALQELSMPSCRFAVKVNQIPLNAKGFYGKFGRDQIEFLIETNPGEGLLPLKKIASGGEVSRILLAIKSIFGRAENIPILIFDEIDAGVSGKTAIRLAEMLHHLADEKQVLCVSHMAQIVATADSQFLLEKKLVQGRTRTQLTKLDRPARLRELARLLSGNPDDQSSLLLANEMLELYPDRQE